MAYKYKLTDDRHQSTVTRVNGKRYVAGKCTQDDLEFLYNEGAYFVEREEVKEKKESKKVSKKEESLEDEQGQ